PARDGNLYGTTRYGGANSHGRVFRLTTNGALTTLYSFGPVTNNVFANIDGAYPEAGLVQASDGNLYGTTAWGGASGSGTLFRITTNGAFTLLYSFIGGSDGGGPESALVQASDGNLYGTSNGGARGYGTLFRITTNGIFTLLHSFTGFNDGAQPYGLVQASDGNLYGTSRWGGGDWSDSGGGIVFRVIILPSTLDQPEPVIIGNPLLSAGNFTFSFQTVAGQSYTI